MCPHNQSILFFIITCIFFVFLAWHDVSFFDTTTKHFQPRLLPGTHIERLLAGCGDVCRIDVRGTPSTFFDYVAKAIDCTALMSNAEIDSAMVENEPPSTIPANMLDAFTYNGAIPVIPHSPNGKVLNQRYLSADALMSTWNRSMVDAWAALCMNRQLQGSYGVARTNEMLGAMKQVPMKNADVLVIGSERPWIEACLLGLGAKSVTTLEYGHIISLHPQVLTVTPESLRKSFEKYKNRFDVIVSDSSLEHSGLGRYGDALNPWGDRQATARAWCMTKPRGYMVLGVPEEGGMFGPEAIVYNAHRVYGPIQLPHLLANWKQVWRAPSRQGIWVVQK